MWWALAGLLIVARIAVVPITLDQAAAHGSHKVLTGDIRRFYKIATAPGTPYRDFQVEYPPLMYGAIKLLDSSTVNGATTATMWTQLVLDLAVAGLLAWGWGRRAGLAYLILGIPFLFYPFLYLRLDLLSVALAVAGLALVRHRRPALGGTALALACFAKVWPVLLVPSLLIRRSWRAVAACVGVGVAGLAAWIAWAGPNGLIQVLSMRGATGWEIESTVGGVVRTLSHDPIHLQRGAWRVGLAPSWAFTLLGVLCAVAVVAVWVLAARRRPHGALVLDGYAALGAVSAFLLCSPLLSPQFIIWLLPFAAIVAARRDRLVGGLVMVIAALLGPGLQPGRGAGPHQRRHPPGDRPGPQRPPRRHGRAVRPPALGRRPPRRAVTSPPPSGSKRPRSADRAPQWGHGRPPRDRQRSPTRPAPTSSRTPRGGSSTSGRPRASAAGSPTTSGRPRRSRPAPARWSPRAERVEWIEVRNEVEAVFLEYNLIKRHRPRFNIRLKDDKSYPYLAVTLDEEWPRAMVMRGAKRKGVRYFGPYAHAYAIRETLDLLLRTFPIRTCTSAKFDRHHRLGRPCLYAHIEKCVAPCVGDIDHDEYMQLVAGADRLPRRRAPPRCSTGSTSGCTSRVRRSSSSSGRPGSATSSRACARRSSASRWSAPARRTSTSSGSPRTRSRRRVQVFFVRKGRVVGPQGPRRRQGRRRRAARRWSAGCSSSCTPTRRPTTCPSEILVPVEPDDRELSRGVPRAQPRRAGAHPRAAARRASASCSPP